MIFLRLGDIALAGPDSPRPFQWEEPHALVRQEIAVGKPRVHGAGDGLREMNLELRLSGALGDPAGTIAALRAAKSQGRILPMVRGDGTEDGPFVIEKFAVSEESHGPDGSLRFATVRLGLVEFVEEAPLAFATPRPRGFAAPGGGGSAAEPDFTPAIPETPFNTIPPEAILPFAVEPEFSGT